MAALRSLTLPLGPFFSADGKLAVGHAVACYNPGTDTLRTWYADAALTTPAPNPDRTGSDGRLAQKFLGVGPSEIRQYAPVSASSTIPDDLQDFPGAAWALVEKWLEDGLVADAGSTIYTVDTVDELRALTDPAAIDGLVAVIGYSSASDWIGVRYYLRDQYSVASDDGGAVLNALAGGRWILKTDGGEVDARIWGVMANGADVTSNLAAAAAWANANGETLYIAPGVYTVSSGSIAIENAHIADGVQIKATSGAYSVELTGHWAVDGTGALQHANSTGDVRLAFGASADVGTAYMAWNGTDGDLGYYPGQNVVHSTDSANLLTIDGPLSLASFTLAKNTNSSITGAVEIGVLHCNGYTLSATDDGTLTIGVFDRAGTDPVGLDWAAGDAPTVRVLYDFRTSDVDVNALSALDGDYKPVTLTVDADRTLTAAAADWPLVTLQGAGGVVDVSTATDAQMTVAEVRGDAQVFGANIGNSTLATTQAALIVLVPGTLQVAHLAQPVGFAGVMALAAAVDWNGDGVADDPVDLGGRTARGAGGGVFIPWPETSYMAAYSIRNGVYYLSGNAALTGHDYVLQDVQLDLFGLDIVGPASLTCQRCKITASQQIETETTNGAVALTLEDTYLQSTGSGRIVVDDDGANMTSFTAVRSHFNDWIKIGHGDVTLLDSEFKNNVYLVGNPRYIRILRNTFTGETLTSGPRIIDVSNVNSMAYATQVLIAENTPTVRTNSNAGIHWPQTRGIFGRQLAANDTIDNVVDGMFFVVPTGGGASLKATGWFSVMPKNITIENATGGAGGCQLTSTYGVTCYVEFDVSR